MIFPQRFCITGTDTDIGKTVVAALLTKGLGASYFKPIQSGTDQGSDTDTVRHLTGLPQDHFIPPVYTFKAPLSPHLAAEQEQVHIDLSRITLPSQAGPPASRSHLVVEGAGGLMVPLNDRELMIDLIGQLALPVILVAANRLGTINQTLLSLQALALRSIPVIGVILNLGRDDNNARAIAHFGKVPILAQIPRLDPLSPSALATGFNRFFGD
ncbi:dethiobiotin synthase [Desulfoplanes formicivorans]|uniref:ATP-dependent dethiobiotin synthetase BioD n=1 Tax=Desulfoplanes formicivorans TaxID=1592317 RepID=A0A194AID6_9BACT|nr:dethiobiotin synthase [Desulfoplanes formicivorans]GAU08995.1 dithiobiotin synthetase [Desulfoplanes formicivorans]